MNQNISPLDGKYKKDIRELENYFSEYAFTRYRLFVEIEYLLKLAPYFSLKIDSACLKKLVQDFSENDFLRVKEIENQTAHDVKALEYFLREKITQKELFGLLHFGLTSEDINNLAYALLIKDALHALYLPKAWELLRKLSELALFNKDLVMPARTHGQYASPTTLGKELIYFAHRLNSYLFLMQKIELEGKLNGSVGNYNSFQFALPEVDFLGFSQDFVRSLNLKPALITTQINPDTSLINLFSLLINFNHILIDFCQDLWGYISLNYFTQIIRADEVGSSTMPHKVNPIDFENAEGNLKIANSFFALFVNTLPISRFQRDLSNSTIRRNYGSAFSHAFLAYKNILKGLSKITPNHEKIKEDLNSHPEVLTEAYQTYLRKINYPDPYELFKELSRGKKVTLLELHSSIDALNISDQDKEKLKSLKVDNYYGLAPQLVELGYEQIVKSSPKQVND